MDYNLMLSELQNASTFDLYRLQAAIAKLLDDPHRVLAIKRQLRPGMEITYFHQEENRLIPARLLEVRKTRAVVQDLQSERRWTIPLFMFNLQGADTDIAPRSDGVDRLSLRIGDRVGFTARDGEELFGTVTKLNPKRAKIQTTKGVWAVPYAMLFTVLDGEQADNRLIPAKPTRP
jgi:hypothetical protein